MDTFLFWFLSMLEYFAIFFFMFRLFTFRIKEYISEIIFSSIILTFVSDSLRNAFDLGFIDPLVQILLFCALLWQVFKVHIFYALIMSVSMAFYNTIQALLYALLVKFGWISTPMTIIDIRSIQLLTVFVVMFIGLMLQWKNWRYTFVPTDKHLKVKYGGNNLALLVIIVLELIILGTGFYYYTSGYNIILSVSIVSVIIMLGYLHFINKKEIEE
jgi:hypothetical protein